VGKELFIVKQLTTTEEITDYGYYFK